MGTSKYSRAEAGEKIFRQTKQKSARVVAPTRRNFVTYDGKGSAMISCDEFLEMPFKKGIIGAPRGHPHGALPHLPAKELFEILYAQFKCHLF